MDITPIGHYYFTGDLSKGIFAPRRSGTIFTEDIFVANGFERIVHGRRGAYVEFLVTQVYWKNFFRLSSHHYYVDYRLVAGDDVKLYLQKRTVAYADYRKGLCYMSVLKLRNFEVKRIREEHK